MSRDEKDRVFLREEIAAAELKLAQMDFQEASEEAAAYIISGQMIPEDLRFRVQDAVQKLKNAKARWDQAREALDKAMGR